VAGLSVPGPPPAREHVRTVYDFTTIAILWFAGASAMAGLLNLIPRYLPRFGMAPHWVVYRRPLVLVLFAIAVVVTLFFDARVEAQAGAYATGVLALILSAAVAVALALWRESRATRAISLYFWLVSGVFLFTLIDNVIERPDGNHHRQLLYRRRARLQQHEPLAAGYGTARC